MKKTFLALLGGALLVLAGCDGGGGGGGGGITACTLSGTLSTELDLDPGRCSSYRVTGDLFIEDGGKLVAPPGTTLVFDQDTGISVSGHGALVAEGSAADPVVFKGASAIPGYWKGIVFTDADSFDNKLIHAEIRDAAGENLWDSGAFEDFRAALVLWGRTRLRVESTKIWKNDGAAIFVDDDVRGLTLSQNRFTENASYPVLIYASQVNRIGSGNIFSGNGSANDFIHVAGGYTEVADGRWARHDVPYMVFGEATVKNGSVLTIDPGTTLVFEQDAGLIVGGSSAGLRAAGTSGAPILFTGKAAHPGYWCGIIFSDSNNSSNLLDHVTVEYGGSGSCTQLYSSKTANVLVESAGSASHQYLRLTHSRIQHSAGYGVVIATETNANDIPADNTFFNNQLGDFYRE